MSDILIKQQSIVFNIVQEYLNKNRFFVLDDIIPFINVRLKEFSVNLNYNGIREILKSLIQKKRILERSKLVKDEILDNENRNNIFNFIVNNPGVYFNQIAKKLFLSNYILAWHIKMLKQFSYIRSAIIEKHEAFFIRDLNPENDNVLFLISKEKPKKIIHFLIKNQEGASKTEISRELKMHSSTVSNYITQLKDYGILLEKKLSRNSIYFINEKFYYQLLNC